MRRMCHTRRLRSYSALVASMAFSVWSFASVLPPSAHSVGLPLGLATGSKEAQIALDGTQWAVLASASTPVFDGTVLRTGNGAISTLLKDGTQLELLPHTVVETLGSRGAPVIRIAVGRVLFRLPASSAMVLVTPGVRYHAAAKNESKGQSVIKVAAPISKHSPSDQLGEITVTREGGSRVKLVQGEIIARPLNDPGIQIVKTGQSASIPPAGVTDPSFKTLLAQALPGETPTQPLPDETLTVVPTAGDGGPTLAAGGGLSGVTLGWMASLIAIAGGGVAAATITSERPASPSVP